MASLFEEMGGTYTLGADGMYYPNLELPEEETPRYSKYGRMRHTYLREHKKAYYTTLLFDGKLVAHLNEIDEPAHARMELLTKQMAAAQGITEALKAKDQMAWVGAMNNIRSAAEEIILSELIFHNISPVSRQHLTQAISYSYSIGQQSKRRWKIPLAPDITHYAVCCDRFSTAMRILWRTPSIFTYTERATVDFPGIKNENRQVASRKRGAHILQL